MAKTSQDKPPREDRRTAFARVDAAAQARYDAWPEWKKNPTRVPVLRCSICGSRRSPEQMAQTAKGWACSPSCPKE